MSEKYISKICSIKLYTLFQQIEGIKLTIKTLEDTKNTNNKFYRDSIDNFYNLLKIYKKNVKWYKQYNKPIEIKQYTKNLPLFTWNF